MPPCTKLHVVRSSEPRNPIFSFEQTKTDPRRRMQRDTHRCSNFQIQARREQGVCEDHLGSRRKPLTPQQQLKVTAKPSDERNTNRSRLQSKLPLPVPALNVLLRISRAVLIIDKLSDRVEVNIANLKHDISNFVYGTA